MSFTVQHVKNGKIIPIKLSVWDAFKGVPNAKPRKPKPSNFIPETLHQVLNYGEGANMIQCTCCKKVHLAEKATATSHDGNKKDDEKSNKKPHEKKSYAKPDTQVAGAQVHSDRAEETYSADDDATIIAMKTAGKNWKVILGAINKESLSQLKSHWKLIDPTPKETGSGAEKKKIDEDAEAKKKDGDEKQAKIEKAKAEGQAAKKKKKEQEKNDTVVVKKKEKEKDAEKTVVGANDMKTFASQYDKQKWKTAASRHFDLTGQRISPETARKMAEE